MNWDDLRKRLMPHIIIVLIFLAVTFAFLSPMLQGKVIPQNDVRQWQGSYQETKEYLEKTGDRTLWTNSMFGGMPTYQIAPHSETSLWGTRILYNILVSGGWGLPAPANALFLYCFGFYLLLLAFRVNHWLALAGALAYAFSSFNIIIIEAGHMLQAYALATAPLVLAAVVYTIRWRKLWLGGALFTLALAFHLRTNHPQISFYTALVLGIYLLSEIIMHIREKKWLYLFKVGGVFLAGSVLAIASTATFLMTTAEYSTETIRGKSDLTKAAHIATSGLDRDYAFRWSYGQGETFSLMIPDFRGGPSGAIQEHNPESAKEADPNVRQYVSSMDEYWGIQPFTSGPVYHGAIICFLFVLGLVFLRGHDRWWILAVTIFSIILAWGRDFPSFNNWMFDHFPLYNKFRSVSYTLVMASMVMPLLAILVVDRLMNSGFEWNKKTRQRFFTAAGIAGGLCLLFFLAPSLGGDFRKPEKQQVDPKTGEVVLVDADKEMLLQGVPPEQANDPQVQQTISAILDGVYAARADILSDDAIRSFFYILLAAVLLYLFFSKVIKQKEWIYGGLALFILVDQYSVDKRYLNEKHFKKKNTAEVNFFPSDADMFIRSDKDPDYRVLNLYNAYTGRQNDVFNDATTSFYHKSIGGYHGAKLRRIQDLIENHLGDEVGLLQQNIQKIPGQSLVEYMHQSGDLSSLNMLNTKYIIYGPTRKEVIVNPYALGHAWFVKGVKMVPNADAEIKAMERFNPRDTAIIDTGIFDGRFRTYMNGFSPSGDTTGTIKMLSYKPNELTYESNSSSEQFAVFSEMYYDNKKGWNVYIDGKKADQHIRVNFVLRGMRVPAGKHTIVFKFEPASYAKGEQISLIASLGVLLALIGAIYYEWRRSKKAQAPARPAA